MKPADIMTAVGRARAYLAGGDSEPYKADTTKMIAEALVALQERVLERALAGDVIERETAYSPAIIWAQTARMGANLDPVTSKSNGRTLVAVELPRNCRLMDAGWPSMEVAREQAELALLRSASAKLAAAISGRPRSGDEVVVDALSDFVASLLSAKIVDERTALPWAR